MPTKPPEILLSVHGEVGIGKSAVALLILDALRAAGLSCSWADETSERNMGQGAEDVAALDPKPVIRLIETNPRILEPAKVSASGRCADALRDAGTAAPRYCERCGLGPCAERKPAPPPACTRCGARTRLACGGTECPNRTGGA